MNHPQSLMRSIFRNRRRPRLRIYVATMLVSIALLGVSNASHAQTGKPRLRDWQRKGYFAALDDWDNDTAKRALGTLLVYRDEPNFMLPNDKLEWYLALTADESEYYRITAIRALISIGADAVHVRRRLREMLRDSEWGVRAVACAALWRLGDEEAKLLMLQWLELGSGSTKEQHERIRSATQVLELVGPEAVAAVPQLVRLLDDYAVTYVAIGALGNMGPAARESAKSLGRLYDKAVKNDELVTAARAYWALQKTGYIVDDAIIARLTQALRSGIGHLQHNAAIAVQSMGGYGSDLIPSLIPLLDDEEYVADEVMLALMEVTNADDEDSASLETFLRQARPEDRRRAARVLASWKRKEAIHELIGMLEKSDTRVLALEGLEDLGPLAAEHLPKLFTFLTHDQYKVRYRAFDAIMEMDQTAAFAIPAILEGAYIDKDSQSYARLATHVLGGGDEPFEIALQWLACTDLPTGSFPSDHDQVVKVVKVLTTLWEPSKSTPKFRRDLTYRLTSILRNAHERGLLSANDAPSLTEIRSNMAAAGMSEAAEVRTILDSVDPPKSNASRYSPLALVIHFTFWLILLLVYPHSETVQTYFFWNRWVRRFAGLGYVEAAFKLPYIRRRLLWPFREYLIADAALDSFDADSYFRDRRVLDRSASFEKQLMLRKVIEECRGRVILEGASGLGKTMAIRYRIKQNYPHRLAVYLPAERCSSGVVEAILEKLEGPAKDPEFVRALLYVGALDIYIDGLNEADAETRAKITTFLDGHARGTTIVTTQPLQGWKPPRAAQIFELQPLDDESIEAFLVSREAMVDEVDQDVYRRKCKAFLRDVFNKDQPEELRNEKRAVLSNPMDLTIAASMLARGITPDLYRLQEQQYDDMARNYRNKTGQPFPIDSVARIVYEMRVNAHFVLPYATMHTEIRMMEESRMVLPRHRDGEGEPKWYFRHEKIADFFIAYAFRFDNTKELRTKHMHDSRFRGVYFLLALLLDFDDAWELREEFVNYAAKTGDYSTSSGVVKLLSFRCAREGRTRPRQPAPSHP